MLGHMRICFFGDSFVNGTGDPDYLGWVGRVCAAARRRGDDITAYNCGVRRATSEDVRQNWLAEATARLPSELKGAVVFSFGANDRHIEHGAPRISLPQQMDATRAILTTAIARWPTLFIASPGPRDDALCDRAAERVQGAREICDQLHVPFLDAFTASARFKLWPVEAANGDGAHPGAGGYGELAAVVDAWEPWRTLIEDLRA